MGRVRVELLPEAVAEFREARVWYAARDAGVGERFSAAIDSAIEGIADAPDRWSAFEHGTRRYVLRAFPYVVIYRVFPDRVQVVAFHHARRRPGGWVGRLK